MDELKMFGFEDEIDYKFFLEYCIGKDEKAPRGEEYDRMLAEYREKVKEENLQNE
jgi:hypothetical protein